MPVESTVGGRGECRAGRATVAELHAQLGHRDGVGSLVNHAVASGRWVLGRARWKPGHHEFTYLVALCRPGRGGLDEVTVEMRLPSRSPDSELVLARTASAAVTTRPDTVARWLTDATPSPAPAPTRAPD